MTDLTRLILNSNSQAKFAILEDQIMTAKKLEWMEYRENGGCLAFEEWIMMDKTNLYDRRIND